MNTLELKCKRKHRQILFVNVYRSDSRLKFGMCLLNHSQHSFLLWYFRGTCGNRCSFAEKTKQNSIHFKFVLTPLSPGLPERRNIAHGYRYCVLCFDLDLLFSFVWFNHTCAANVWLIGWDSPKDHIYTNYAYTYQLWAQEVCHRPKTVI